jgi:hypothetical protein
LACHYTVGLKRLCAQVEPGTAEDICARIIVRLIDTDITTDDAALLVECKPDPA